MQERAFFTCELWEKADGTHSVKTKWPNGTSQEVPATPQEIFTLWLAIVNNLPK